MRRRFDDVVLADAFPPLMAGPSFCWVVETGARPSPLRDPPSNSEFGLEAGSRRRLCLDGGCKGRGLLSDRRSASNYDSDLEGSCEGGTNLRKETQVPDQVSARRKLAKEDISPEVRVLAGISACVSLLYSQGSNPAVARAARAPCAPFILELPVVQFLLMSLRLVL